MSLTELKLTLNPSTDNYQYIISQIVTVDDGGPEKPATTIAPPGQSYKNQILMGVGGQKKNITINFRIHNGNYSSDETVDKANSGSSGYGSNVVTIDEQIDYISNVIQDPGISASWTLTGGRFGDFNDPSTGLDVYFEDFSTSSINMNSPRWREARISLIVGESI